MRIKDWECVISPDGMSRGASHKDEGSVVYIHGVGLRAHAAVPPEVMDWLMRPRLRVCWEEGCIEGAENVLAKNPYLGEPPNKDKGPL